jgi:hypothetical protein
VIPLIAGTVLALLALAFVLYPLFIEPRHAGLAQERESGARPASEPSAAERAVAVLREVEFDRETGKLSDSDYAALKATYTREALAALRAEGASPAGESGSVISDVEVEAVILAYRARRLDCATCGPRPEPDAIYCSTCGRYLAGVCSRCGAPVTEPAARFCSVCGGTLAA